MEHYIRSLMWTEMNEVMLLVCECGFNVAGDPTAAIEAYVDHRLGG